MKFWDSSALVPLFVQQAATPVVRKILDGDPHVAGWALSEIEVRAAVCRLWREQVLDAGAVGRAFAEFDLFWSGTRPVSVVEPVILRAKRLLGAHRLRAADALQLAAALVAASDQPDGWEFVSLDRPLAEAALREGFRILP